MKLSIITINYNNGSGLSQTMKSVLDQTWKDFEYIIIDGGSSDESVEILKKYQEKLSYWVSEPDRGVFHAMNKGIIKAEGEYLLMLNSGDILCNAEVLSQVFKDKTVNEDFVYGDVYRESKGKIFTKSKFPDKLTFFFLHNGAVSHQAAFIKKELHNKVGLYEENMKFSSDWSFILLAICKYNATYKHLHQKISVCNCDGLTCSSANAVKIQKEREYILKKEFPAFIDDYHRFVNFHNSRKSKRMIKTITNLVSIWKSKLMAVKA